MRQNGIDFDKLYSLDETTAQLMVDTLGTIDRVEKADLKSISFLKQDENSVREVKNILPDISKTLAKSIRGINSKNKDVEIGKLKLALLNMQDVFAKMGFNTVSRTRSAIDNTIKESMEFNPSDLNIVDLTNQLKSIIITIEMKFK